MIEVRGATFRYADESAPAVLDAVITAGPGQRVGIVGPNGSGKSTLGRLMKGLLIPQAGDVIVDGLNSRDHGLEVRRRVGLVFQNPNSQIVNAAVEHEVAFGVENLGLPAAEIRTRVNAALESVGMAGQEHTECHSLAMSDKQRVALAAVMAMEPAYLILDEPTAWIEPSARWPILREVTRWAEQRGAGLVLVTHRMDEAMLCDHLFGILHGRVVAAGAPETVLGDEETRDRLALEIPGATMLARDLQIAGLSVPARGSIDDLAEALCRS